MTVAATGIFALPLGYLKATLAASATFQALVGVSDANSALAHIFEGEADETEGRDLKPRAIVDIGSEHSFEKVSSTGFLGGGQLDMFFEIPTPPAYQDNLRDARRDHYNKVGAIIGEMMALAGQAGYLNIVGFQERNTGRADPRENNGETFWVSDWNIIWQG